MTNYVQHDKANRRNHVQWPKFLRVSPEGLSYHCCIRYGLRLEWQVVVVAHEDIDAPGAAIIRDGFLTLCNSFGDALRYVVELYDLSIINAVGEDRFHDYEPIRVFADLDEIEKSPEEMSKLIREFWRRGMIDQPTFCHLYRATLPPYELPGSQRHTTEDDGE